MAVNVIDEFLHAFKFSEPVTMEVDFSTQNAVVLEMTGAQLREIVQKAYEHGRQARRERLPDDRPPGVTYKVKIGGEKVYVTANCYPDGRLAEVFLRIGTAVQGTTLSGFADALSIMISLSLQYGVPLNHICDKLEHMRFEPKATPGRSSDLPRALWTMSPAGCACGIVRRVNERNMESMVGCNA